MKKFQLKRRSGIATRLLGQYILNPRTSVRARHFYRYASTISFRSLNPRSKMMARRYRDGILPPVVKLNPNAPVALIKKQIREAWIGRHNSNSPIRMRHNRGGNLPPVSVVHRCGGDLVHFNQCV